MRRRAVLVAVLCIACGLTAAASAAPAGSPRLTFKLFTATKIAIGQVFWTGRRFMYANERAGILTESNAEGGQLQPFVRFARPFARGTEARCAVATGRGWPRGVYCHTPGNDIVWISIDGKTMKRLAKLPSSAAVSDGGIAFDTVGRFGHRLLVASGGSSSGPAGGAIYAITPHGKVALIGKYPGPGGADNIVVAPPGFGSAGGSVLIAVDQQEVSGRLLAMTARGAVSTLVDHLGDGLNPIQVIKPAPRRHVPGSAAPGLYFSDDQSGNVYFAPAAPLRAYPNDVVVGSEAHAWFWLIRPRGTGFQALRLRTNLPTKKWGIESAAYVP